MQSVPGNSPWSSNLSLFNSGPAWYLLTLLLRHDRYVQPRVAAAGQIAVRSREMTVNGTK